LNKETEKNGHVIEQRAGIYKPQESLRFCWAGGFIFTFTQWVWYPHDN